MAGDFHTSDRTIRSALHTKYLRRTTARPDTLVIDELGLAHSRRRVDVAVINGSIHGYEIKSSRDTLDRLDAQLEIYRQTLQKLTIVAAPQHIVGLPTFVPEWCGLIEVTLGPKRAIRFRSVRSAARNPDVDPFMQAHLLWRDEVVHLLIQRGFSPKDLRRPRKQLYRILSESLTPNQITTSIRLFMAQRPAWRDRPVLASYDG